MKYKSFAQELVQLLLTGGDNLVNAGGFQVLLELRQGGVEVLHRTGGQGVGILIDHVGASGNRVGNTGQVKLTAKSF